MLGPNFFFSFVCVDQHKRGGTKFDLEIGGLVWCFLFFVFLFFLVAMCGVVCV